MSSWNFVLIWVEHEKSFITSWPDSQTPNAALFLFFKGAELFGFLAAFKVIGDNGSYILLSFYQHISYTWLQLRLMFFANWLIIHLRRNYGEQQVWADKHLFAKTEPQSASSFINPCHAEYFYVLHSTTSFILLTCSARTLVKSMYRKFNFLISQPKHMLWVFKRTVSLRWFFLAPKAYVKIDG